MSAPGSVAVDAGKTMLSQWLIEAGEVLRSVRPGSRSRARACSQRLSSRIWRPLRAEREACEQGASVRRPDRDDTVHPCVGSPGVDQRRTASPPMLCATISGRAGGCRFDPPNSLLDDRCVVVDRSEHRLEVDRHVRNPELAQPLQPAGSTAPIADEAVHQDDADRRPARRRQVIWLRLLTERAAASRTPAGAASTSPHQRRPALRAVAAGAGSSRLARASNMNSNARNDGVAERARRSNAATAQRRPCRDSQESRTGHER